MKKLALVLIAATVLASCSTKKDDPEPDPGIAAQSGKISYKVDGKAVSYPGTGYVLEDEFSFLKWESGKEQLSIDFYGLNADTYTISNAAKATGNAKIYYYPDNVATPDISYISKSGTFIVTSFSNTGTKQFTASGTFSATLEKWNGTTNTGEKIEITNGVFKDIVLADAR